MSIELQLALELGPVKANIVNAAMTTLAGAGVLWLLGVGWRRIATRWEARQAERQPDHTVITSGSSYGDVAGTCTEFVACVRVAPSKRLPTPVQLDVSRIGPFVRSAFGDLFPSAPEVSFPTERVRYRRNGSATGGIAPYLQVWPTGLIEATVPITHTVTASGQRRIPLLEIARTLLPAIRAIQRGGYEAALGTAAVVPLGLDWEIKVSRELVDATSTPWAALEFPGRAPNGRATGQGPPWPIPGFGHDQLLCVSTTALPEDILMPAFADFTARSGYYDAEGAMDDLRTAIRELNAAVPPDADMALDVQMPHAPSAR